LKVSDRPVIHNPQMNSTVPARQGLDYVHRTIREAILDGKLEPGTTMSQVMLADELGVSRTPLREALRMLQNEGLIESEPNRRVRVSEVSLADIEELYTIRVPLEVNALRLSMPAFTPEDIARLEGFMAEMAHFAEQEDYGRWHVPHRAFHAALTERAGPRYEALLMQLFDHAERYRRIHVGRSFSERTTAEHRAIVDAVKAGDADNAAACLARHLARSAFTVIDLIDAEYDPVSLKRVLADISAAVGEKIDVRPAQRSRPAGRSARSRK
jgi:GntR family transcriptional regulator, rspAB operon transcriptional repressor